MTTATLEQVLVGQPETFHTPGARQNPEWTSAIRKRPVAGPVLARELGLEGDAVANPQAHGGRDKAVMAYSRDHVAAWHSELPDLRTDAGAFGENLAVAGLDEFSVCLGDRWRLGEVELEVSHPRQPCWKLARLHDRPDLPKRVVATARSGWYLRVLREGPLEAGQAIETIARPHEAWPLVRVAAIYYGTEGTASDVRELASLPALADAWRREL